MHIAFKKYQGTGNDFVIIDDRHGRFPVHERALVARLCDRRFGVGADGLILLRERTGYDFEMVYFNADGGLSSMCGNGGRCIVAFAASLGIVAGQACSFWAADGPHDARIAPDGQVELRMADVAQVAHDGHRYLLDTGSPHYVAWAGPIEAMDVKSAGQGVRYSEPFRAQGVNVNFVEDTPQGIRVATYERGVEDETLSCGTGVTAAAIAHALRSPAGSPPQQLIHVDTKGGQLAVRLSMQQGRFTDIWLCGPAVLVFEGTIEAQ